MNTIRGEDKKYKRNNVKNSEIEVRSRLTFKSRPDREETIKLIKSIVDKYKK